MQAKLCQLALTTQHPEACCAFYQHLLGFRLSGTQRIRGIAAGKIFSVNKVNATCQWLCGDDPFFQLELFHFQLPLSKHNKVDVSALGYNTLFIEVPDIKALLSDSAITANISIVTRYEHEGITHLVAKDIDHNILSFFSSEHSHQLNQPTFRGVAATVQNIDEEVKRLTSGFQLDDLNRGASGSVDGSIDGSISGDAKGNINEDAVREGIKENAREHVRDNKNHTPLTPIHSAFDPLFKRHECMPCNIAQNNRHFKSKTLGGSGYFLQLIEYANNATATPSALTDQGILNIAFGIREQSQFATHYEQLLALGYKNNTRPVGDQQSNTVYLHSDSLSIEFLQIPENIQADWGFPEL